MMSSNELQPNTCSNGETYYILIYSKNLFPLLFSTSAQFHKHFDNPITDRKSHKHMHVDMSTMFVRTFH